MVAVARALGHQSAFRLQIVCVNKKHILVLQYVLQVVQYSEEESEIRISTIYVMTYAYSIAGVNCEFIYIFIPVYEYHILKGRRPV